MATHSSTLAWRIPRTEEPGGLQSTKRRHSYMGDRHAAVHRVAKSQTWLKQRSAHTRTQKGGMGEVGAGRLRGRIYMYTYSWFMLMYTRNQHNIVKQLSSNLKINFFKRLEVRNQVESHFLLLLRLLPLHREENAFPEAPWLTHCCNFHSWITWANLASKGCGKMNTWGGQTRGKWLGMALDRPPRRRLSFLKHLNGKWIWWNRGERLLKVTWSLSYSKTSSNSGGHEIKSWVCKWEKEVR